MLNHITKNSITAPNTLTEFFANKILIFVISKPMNHKKYIQFYDCQDLQCHKKKLNTMMQSLY